MSGKGPPASEQKAGVAGGQESGEEKRPTVEEELAVLELEASCFDGFRRMLYSKTEWEAYLLERMEKKKKADELRKPAQT